MKKILIVFAAATVLMGCARDRAEEQWSAMDANGYRSEQPRHIYPPPPVELRPRINGQSGVGPGP
jgi:hypothetical protein